MKIKIALLLFIAVYCSGISLSQNINFEYDDSGNCVIKRKTIVVSRSQKSYTETESITENTEAEPLGKYEILIMPNPTKGLLKIEIKGKATEGNFNFSLSDSSGKIIQKSSFSGNFFSFDISSCPTGIYILSLKSGKEMKEWKIIKE